MAAVNSVWGIDIGQCALKAMKLVEQKDGQLQVEAFEVVEHSQVLSQPDADAPLIIATSIDEFLRRVDVTDTKVAVSVLGQSSFTRFVKLPPVEKSKIPDIVRFEAEQQIPFPIEEVIWRYQTFQDEDSPEVEAGIFAMKQIDVAEMLTYYANAGLDVDIVQMSPLALYNFMKHDNLVEEDGATLLADVGADKTHLVVADGNRIWTRTIQIGGNNFTEALVKSFKLSFAKAEKLKRTAASSKYARQIFQVMRPVFADLVQEIQRSIGYYTQLNRDSRFKKMIGMGNGFRLPGMQKYLEQNLNMSVMRIEGFKDLYAAPENLKDHILSLGVIYGLCLQGLGKATVHTSLLPEAIAKKRLWAKKRPMFVAAAACLMLAAGIFVFRSYADLSVMQAPEQQALLENTENIVGKLNDWKRQDSEIKTSVKDEESQIVENFNLRAYSRIWPAINACIAKAILHSTSEIEQQILEAFPTIADPNLRKQQAEQVQSDQAMMALISMLPGDIAVEGQEKTPRQQLIERLMRKPRNQRDIVIIESMDSEYMSSIKLPSTEAAAPVEQPSRSRRSSRKSRSSYSAPKAEDTPRGFEITIQARTPLTGSQLIYRVGTLKNALKQAIDADVDLELVGSVEDTYPNATQPKPAVRDARIPAPGRAVEGESEIPFEFLDPLFEGESKQQDNQFTLTLRVAVKGNGVTLPESMKVEKPSMTSDRRGSYSRKRGRR